MLSVIPVSFEFFPPKSPEGVALLSDTACQLAPCDPVFFSVTFGALGSVQDGTLQAVKLLQNRTPVPVAAHLSCIGAKKEDIVKILNTYKALGMKRLVTLRGDMPQTFLHSGELQFASELVALIRETTGDYFHIEVAAYPEFHPQAQNAYEDIANLKRKYEAGADSAITQYFFNPDAYFYFIDDCAKQGIDLPIVPGIMPITHFSKLVRFSNLCGAEIPRWIAKRLEAYGDDLRSIEAFGVEVVSHLCEQLIAGGAPGLHFYTLNHAAASLALWQQVVGNRQQGIHLLDTKSTSTTTHKKGRS